MTDSSEDFAEEIDTLIEDVISVDEGDKPSTATEHNTEGWFKEEFTLRKQHDEDYIVTCAVNEIEHYATELDNGESQVTMAEQLVDQYVAESEKQFVTELVAAAAFYCASKINGGAVDPTQIAKTGPAVVTRKHLLRRSKEMAATLGLDPSAFFDVRQYVDRYCEELELDSKVRKAAYELLEEAEKENVTSGKSPTALAAGAVYWASSQEGVGINQDEVSEVANVSTVTIRNRYQEIAEATN